MRDLLASSSMGAAAKRLLNPLEVKVPNSILCCESGSLIV